MKLYLATTNPGKLRDFATAAESTGNHITLLPLPGLKDIPAPAEDEPTFAANATVKALAYARHAPGHIILADDSGLEVDALHGAPGVRSARYAQDLAYRPDLAFKPDMLPPEDTADHPDALNNLCLLHSLAAVPPPRPARYRCVLAAALFDGSSPAQIIATAHGTVEGQILTAPRGTLGFGYDPLFYLPPFDRTMAELDPTTRLSISHRGQALRNLIPLLNHQLQAQQIS